MNKLVYVRAERTIPAPLAKTWEIVAIGYGHVARYNPEIKESRFDSSMMFGVGTRRHCDTLDGGFLKEEITEWREKEYFKLVLTDTSFPMAVIQSRFEFKESNNHTIVIQEFWYRMKSPMGWLSGLMKGKMKKTLERGLEGLEYYVVNNKKIK